MSTLGVPFLEGEPVSNARRNATSVISMNGDQIASLPSDQEFAFFRCKQTSGGLKQDEFYGRSADNLTLLNFRRKHAHNEDTDEAGGTMLNMFINNPKMILFGQRGFNTLDEFVVTLSGTATISEQVNDAVGRYHRLQSTWNAGGSTGYYINARSAGIQISLAQQMLAIFKMQLDFDANQVCRVGFGMEEANAGVDNTPKAGIEMCNATGTAWQVITADGLARTVTPSPVQVKPTPAQFRDYRIFVNPISGEVKFASSDGNGKIATSNFPSGIIEPKRRWSEGINTTNSTTKNLYLANVFFAALNGDTLWFSQPEDANPSS